MKSKRPPGPADGERASDAEDESIEESIDDSLNQILAESEAGTGSAATQRPGVDEEVTADVVLEADSAEPDEPVVTPSDEPAPTDEIRALTVPAPESPEAAASMSGPALVDDAKEEHTDVESPESMAAAAAEAEKALQAADAAPDQVGTPVRQELAANLAKASVGQEEIITASGSSRPGDEVITAENAGFFTQPKNAAPASEDSEGTMSLGPAVGARGEPSLAEQSREERERGLRRSRPPTPITPLPRLRDRARGDDLAGDGSLEPELEVGALDYGRQRSSSPPPGDDGHSARRSGVEARPSGYGGEASNPRMTPPVYPSSGPGSGRHTLPPPSPRVTPPSGRGRLPTPKPGVPVSVTPSPRISSTGIPISAAGSSGPMPMVRGSTSAVFSKVQLPLGGLVTVVGAAFGVGLIIGAVLWRGSAEPASEGAGHATAEGKAPPTPAAAEPTPAPAPVAAANAPAAPPPASEPVAAPAAAPVPPPAPAVSAAAIAPGAPAAEPTPAPPSPPTVNAKESSKKVASATPKPARTKKTAAASTTGKTDGPAKSKGATWVDPFAQ